MSGDNQDAFMAEDENDDIADISDDELIGDGDAAHSKSKSRQMQVSCLKKLRIRLRNCNLDSEQ